MFVEHVELFRCLAPHEESSLVAAVDRTVERRILRGTLGCPVCRAAYPIVRGVAWFGVPVEDRTEAPGSEASAEDVMRVAALLGLQEPGGTVALAGEWAAAAAPLAELTRVRTILVNPAPGAPALDESSVVRCLRLPLGGGVLRGAALDAANASGHLLASAALAVRLGGRVVAPADAPLPSDLRELARDGREWVAERAVTSSAPVRLSLVRPRGARGGAVDG